MHAIASVADGHACNHVAQMHVNANNRWSHFSVDALLSARYATRRRRQRSSITQAEGHQACRLYALACGRGGLLTWGRVLK